MKLSEVPSGSTVFIDANIPLTVILREQRGPIAQEFLNRVEDGEITADPNFRRVDFITCCGED
jgi:hypothetical protein